MPKKTKNPSPPPNSDPATPPAADSNLVADTLQNYDPDSDLDGSCVVLVTCRPADIPAFTLRGFYHETAENDTVHLRQEGDYPQIEANLPRQIPYLASHGIGLRHGPGEVACDGQTFVHVPCAQHEDGFLVPSGPDGLPDPATLERLRLYSATADRVRHLLQQPLAQFHHWCRFCEVRWPDEAIEVRLAEIEDLAVRVEPGGEVPSGLCPKCDALVFLRETATSTPLPTLNS